MRAFDCRLRFSPSSARQKLFVFRPFQGIDGDDIDIAKQPPMLKPIVEQKHITKIVLFCEPSRFKPVASHNHGYAASSARNQEGFVAGLPPAHRRALATADDKTAFAGAPVTSRQNNRTKSFGAEALGEGNDERSLTGSSQGEVADADYRVLQVMRWENARFVEPVPSLEQVAKNRTQDGAPALVRSGNMSVFKDASARSVAPLLLRTIASAREPISDAIASD